MNTEKNVMQIEEEDIAFFNLLMLLPREKKLGSRNFVVDATFLYLVASTLNGIQNAFKWNTVISDFW